MTDTAIAIQTQQLIKWYGKTQALRGVDLEVQRGEIFGFLGPNGSGKTTTIRCLLDLIRPQGGSAQVLGMDPQKQPVAVHARTGYLPGELHIEDNFSVEAALRYFNRLRNNQADWDDARQLASRLQLDLKMQFKNLSSGQLYLDLPGAPQRWSPRSRATAAPPLLSGRVCGDWNELELVCRADGGRGLLCVACLVALRTVRHTHSRRGKLGIHNRIFLEKG